MSRLRGVFLAGSFAVLSSALLGASCNKKEPAEPQDLAPLPPEKPLAPTGPDGAAAKPAEVKPARDLTPPKGVDLRVLDDAKKARWLDLADKLPSPCGKAQSL